jgi:hypothetical protein
MRTEGYRNPNRPALKIETNVCVHDVAFCFLLTDVKKNGSSQLFVVKRNMCCISVVGC